VTGDDYAGSTFKHDFASDGIPYRSCRLSTSELYENMEPALNAGEIELPDLPKLQEQLLTLVICESSANAAPMRSIFLTAFTSSPSGH
jgi:hypothetical protein